ncbi:MAG: hypothetical protein MK179_05635 [Pirellulaceae bacterium]|nr:hypothetical protein [Pirellulaceae bacterium]
MAPFRLIIDSAGDGIWNMSVDEALLQSAAHESFVPTLRFYQWDKPTLSLGYFQQYEERSQHTSSNQCPVVRRSTGGGAILHHHELTYSFVTTVKNRLSRNVEDYYDLFHSTLIEQLAKRGVPCQLWQAKTTGPRGNEPFLCFQRRAAGDVVLGTIKIAGSAQRRHKGCLLQHGSVLLESSSFAPELPGIRSNSGIHIPALDLLNTWTSALEKDLECHFESGKLTSQETDWAKSFANSRFGHVHWTRRR